MTRIAKLYTRAAADPGSLSFKEFERLFTAFGFVLDRTRGSHQVYKREDTPGRLSVQPKSKDAKPYQVRQFLAIVDQYGLTLDDSDEATT